ncbi:MAG: ABC transporter substrate-binding protein [Candidatus Hodarchaeota archaeon]
MNNLKKYIAISIILFANLAICFDWYFINDFQDDNKIVRKITPSNNSIDLKYGTITSPRNLDPHNAYRRGCMDIIDQICEGLYQFNLSSPAYELIPALAASMPIINGTEITIPLKSGIYFQDGAAFNATAVKWNFDRLNHFINYNNNDYLPAPFNVPPAERTMLRGLYSWEYKPIINETIIVNVSTIKLKLNVPKASLINVIAKYFKVLSPKSTPPNRFLEYGLNDILVGTGPFIYDSYLTDVEVKMLANTNYWMGPPKIDTLIFAIYPNDITMCEALLAGDIDIVDAPNREYLDYFESRTDITLVRGGGTFITEYVCMNPTRVNKTWRQAISYAINYDYVIDILMDGEGVRLKSPIPEGIWGSNYTLNYPTFNVTRARTIINNDLGTVYDVNDDGLWASLNLKHFDMVVQDDSDERQDYTDYVCNVVGPRIGLDIERYTTTFEELVYEGIIGGHETPNDPIWPGVYMDLWAIGWVPDYFDPENYVNEFFHSDSALSVGYSNAYLDSLMNNASLELDLVKRKAYYDEIQQILVEDDMPFAWLFVIKNNDAYKKEVGGYITNRGQRVYMYPCYWKELNITHPSNIIYLEGQTGHNIVWNITSNFVESPYYDLYINNVFDTNDTWVSGVPVNISVDGLSLGIYEYRIEVHNGDLEIEDIVYVEVLSLDSLPIDIPHPQNITYTEGQTGNYIYWNITSYYLVSPYYNLYVDDVFNKTNTWASGIPVVINVDGHSIGNYEYRIEVHNGNTTAEDTVYVLVEPRHIAEPFIYGYPVVILLLICFSSIIAIFVRKKKNISY